MTSDESAVWSELATRMGGYMAITNAAIRRRTGIGERNIKAAVEGLIVRHGFKIGSSRGKPAGYYLIETSEELERTCRTLRNQAMSELVRIAALRGRRYALALLGQMELELSDGR